MFSLHNDWDKRHQKSLASLKRILNTLWGAILSRGRRLYFEIFVEVVSKECKLILSEWLAIFLASNQSYTVHNAMFYNIEDFLKFSEDVDKLPIMYGEQMRIEWFFQSN